jgi:hypothetical protein
LQQGGSEPRVRAGLSVGVMPRSEMHWVIVKNQKLTLRNWANLF